MPGFRPGKVPVSLLRKRYGPSVMGEILESAVSSSAEQAMAEKGVRPVSQPQFEVTSFEDGKDLEYTMSFDILPEIKLPDFSKIKIERMVPKVEEKDVEETLKRIADANKTSEPITGNRKTKSGDYGLSSISLAKSTALLSMAVRLKAIAWSLVPATLSPVSKIS